MSVENKSELILVSLLENWEFSKSVLSFLDESYFTQPSHRFFLRTIQSYVDEYGVLPTREVIRVLLEDASGLGEDDVDEVKELLDNEIEKQETDFLIDLTESFCRDRAVYNAIMKSISVYEGDDTKTPITAIPDLLNDAMSVSFRQQVGHDYIEMAEDRWDSYHEHLDKIPFDLTVPNKITTKGGKPGLPKKAMAIIMGPTGGGKSIWLTHNTAAWAMMGYNVLYITLELSEIMVSERIDANLLGVTLDELYEIPKKRFLKLIDNVKQKMTGKIVIKEFPTSGAHVGHFRYVIEELKSKTGFVPDVIVVDYINICLSKRAPANSNSYTTVKMIAEELRGLAVEYDALVWSATQTSRAGYGMSDTDLTDVAESFGLPQTADFFVGLIVTEDLEESGLVMMKQLKNRFGNTQYYNKFVVGLDKSRMKFYDAEINQATHEPDGDKTPVSALETAAKFKKDKVEKFKEFKF